MRPVRPGHLLFLLRLWANTTSIRLAAFAFIALCATFLPLAQVGGASNFRDAHLLHSYEDVAWRSVVEHGELPLWNPYTCGGMYAVGNPQTRFAAPTFAFSLVFGP